MKLNTEQLANKLAKIELKVENIIYIYILYFYIFIFLFILYCIKLLYQVVIPYLVLNNPSIVVVLVALKVESNKIISAICQGLF